MTNSSCVQRPALRQVLNEAVGTWVPAALAAALFFAVPSVGGPQGESPRGPEKREAAAPCGEWHRGGGESGAVDLPAVRLAYRDLAQRAGQSLDRSLGDLSKELNQPYDAGLPACLREASRNEPLEEGKGSLYPGRLLYFAAASRAGQVDLPAEVEKNPRAEILLTRVNSLRDLQEIRGRLGRPVSLASAPFARSLGVRCANTWIKISEKGDAIELHESR